MDTKSLTPVSITKNKTVVRRFITEVLDAGKVDVVDELLASNYKNFAMGGLDRAAFKAFLPSMAKAAPGRRFEILSLTGEGDSVTARFIYHLTLASGEKVDARGLTYYRLANSKIVEDDPLTEPPLSQILAPAATVSVGRKG
jgi:predicted SnoaL-like aldol condensation-catalyzing enzyme